MMVLWRKSIVKLKGLFLQKHVLDRSRILQHRQCSVFIIDMNTEDEVLEDDRSASIKHHMSSHQRAKEHARR
jgi:hypothetical protein